MDKKPLAIDLFCGLGGWTDGLIADDWDVIGFDIVKHDYGDGAKYPAQLVLQDVLTIHGRQFRNTSLIVASPPCQEFSYMAMPWSKAKEKQRKIESSAAEQKRLTALFDACFRIQREASEAAGQHIPMVVENVRGAQKWVGRARWNFGSFYLWGDVPALMPIPAVRPIKQRGSMTPGQQRWCRDGIAPLETGYKSHGLNWSDQTKCGQDFTRVAGWQNESVKGIPHKPVGHWTNPEGNGTKQGGDWFNSSQPSISRLTGSKSNARKAASAKIAKIPFVLASYIAKTFKPRT